MKDFDFPALLDEWQVTDKDFAAAYEQTGDVRRSWLKKSIAHTFTLTGGRPQPASLLQKDWTDGFTARTYSGPCDWVCLCLGADFVSPVQLCAALVPALVAGVKELVVLREENGAPFPASLLTACELSGAETVCQLPASTLLKLIQTRQDAGGSGRILALGALEFSGLRPQSQDILFWQAPLSLQMGIVFSDDCNWNTSSLSWAHPGQKFFFWGTPPAGHLLTLQPAATTPENFRANALFAPAHLLRGQVQLGLAPGHELSWYWPELALSFFLDNRMALSTTPYP